MSGAWLAPDAVAQQLRITDSELAGHLLAGTLRFRVRKVSPGPDVVLLMDVQVAADSVAELERRRWANPVADRLRADGLANRAALKHGVHPNRSSPGVRGPARRRAVS
jgi:hypothetical protein